MRVLICGDRNWRDKATIRKVVMRIPLDWTVMTGVARGADEWADFYARARGLDVVQFPARWDEHDHLGRTAVPCRCPYLAERCKAAGIRRNQQMLAEGRPDLVIYFHKSLERSKGTRDMVRRARAAGVAVYDGRAWSRQKEAS